MLTHPIPLRSDVARFLDAVNDQQSAQLHRPDINELRASYASSKCAGELPVGALATRRDVLIPRTSGDVRACLFDARAYRDPGPLVLFFHGGGFVIGDLQTHAGLCAEIARHLDLPVLAVDYRLAPECPWPAAPDDCEHAARWAAVSPEALERQVTSLVVCGDSAGGNLATATATSLRQRSAEVPVIAQILFYPLADPGGQYALAHAYADGFVLTERSLKFSADAYAGQVEDIRYSPMRGGCAHTPATLIVTASHDPIRDQGRAYAAALATEGVAVVFQEAAGNIHGFATLRRAIPSSILDVERALAAARVLIQNHQLK